MSKNQISAVSEKNLKETVSCLIDQKKRPISGAVINTIVNNIFETDSVSVEPCVYVGSNQQTTINNIKLRVEAPLVLKKFFKPFRKRKYSSINENGYFIYSFSNVSSNLPQEVSIKEQEIMGIFRHFKIDKKVSTDNEKLLVISKFYRKLLFYNSTYEGEVIQLYVLRFLFNDLTDDNEYISYENKQLMYEFVNAEFGKYKDNNIIVNNPDRNYHVGRFNFKKLNDFEYIVLKNFFLAFNNLNYNDKNSLINAYNEFTKGNIKIP